MLLVNYLCRASFGYFADVSALVAAIAFLCCASVAAQTDAATVASPSVQTDAMRPQVTSTVAPPLSSGPRWSELSLSQQEALMPLYGTWTSLDSSRKRKWIGVAQNYRALSSAEQTKLHSRMAEWAALSPSERELARFNFLTTKKIAPVNRTSTWEAYKALSPEERQRLGATASAKPAGTAAANALKPTHPEKLTAVPVTRHTPASVRELVFSKQSIDRNTLLPLATKPVTEQPAR